MNLAAAKLIFAGCYRLLKIFSAINSLPVGVHMSDAVKQSERQLVPRSAQAVPDHEVSTTVFGSVKTGVIPFG